jgi:hypothetical protein
LWPLLGLQLERRHAHNASNNGVTHRVTKPVQPLSHHEILELVQPFSRAGHQVDLAASQRQERRLNFKPVPHPGLAPGGGDVSEALQLTNTRAGRYRLTRTLTLPGGELARLHVDGPDPAELLSAISAIAPQTQFFEVQGCLVVTEQLMPACGGSGALKPAAERVMLANASTQVAGLTLHLRVPAVTGVPADVKLMHPAGDTINVPDDLLAVLGWPWSRLQRVHGGWTGVLRLSGKDEGERYTRSALARERLHATISHLVRTLAEPPARFHERLLRQRWGVTLRRAFPALAGLAMLLGATAVPKIDMAQDSVLRMLIFHSPPLLLVFFFCLREMPRIEIPPPPRASTAPGWRSQDTASSPEAAAPACTPTH